jgi:hypothetical protein
MPAWGLHEPRAMCVCGPGASKCSLPASPSSVTRPEGPTLTVSLPRVLFKEPTGCLFFFRDVL